MRIFIFSLSILLATFSQAQTDLSINEFVASADSLGGISEPGGGYPDWVEIHNLDDFEKNISGYMLSDDYTEIDLFTFPSGTTIPAKGYVIIWADKDLDEEGFHADFKLNVDGEQLILSAPDNTILDSLTFGQQETNVAYARIPNGTGDFTFRAATFGAHNDPTSTKNIDFVEESSIFPNPISSTFEYSFKFHEKFEKKSALFLRIFDNNSKFVRDLEIEEDWNGNELNGIINVSDLPNGFYFLILKSGESSITKKFLIQK